MLTPSLCSCDLTLTPVRSYNLNTVVEGGMTVLKLGGDMFSKGQ